MPLPLIAIPVLHSSGLWIATYAGSYIAGTISSSWIGAFALGNSGLLGALSLVSGAGIFGVAASSGAAAGSALTAVGLGGMAAALGIAPVATFLGLTPFGWAILAITGVFSVGLGLVAYYSEYAIWFGAWLTEMGFRGLAEWLHIAPEPTFLGLTAKGWIVAGLIALFFAVLSYLVRRAMRRMNEERLKGGLEPTTVAGIVKDLRLLEVRAMQPILERLAGERTNVSVASDGKEVTIDGQVFSVGRLRYIVNKNGSEEIVLLTRLGRKRRVLLIKDVERSNAPDPFGL